MRAIYVPEVAVVNVRVDDELHREVNSERSLRGMKLAEYVEEALQRQVEHDKAVRAGRQG